jgi:hypothetical protein
MDFSGVIFTAAAPAFHPPGGLFCANNAVPQSVNKIRVGTENLITMTPETECDCSLNLPEPVCIRLSHLSTGL